MNDYILIWTGFLNILVSIWNFLIGFNNGVVIALLIVMVMIIVLKKIFFRSEENQK